MLEVRRDGQLVARDELGPRGEAVRIDAKLWQPPADALGRCAAAGLVAEGAIQIECALRDERGEVAVDDRVVEIEVDGGELLGLENGDLSDNTPYTAQHRSTFDGRLIVFIRPTGRTTVHLSAAGLPSVRVDYGS